MNVAIIPARGGSKRIPRKNVRLFCGKPMIAWSIEAALASGVCERVVVSTDDAEIAEIARAWGAEAPFIRPAELSNDYIGTTPVIANAVRYLGGLDAVESACCLYATAPFVSPEDLRTGFRMLCEQDCDYAFSVTSYAFPIQRALRVSPSSRVQMVNPEHFSTRSQDLEESFHDAGQFYWGTAKAWLDERVIFGLNSCPVHLPRYRVQDIDTLEDWVRAELMFKALQAQSV